MSEKETGTKPDRSFIGRMFIIRPGQLMRIALASVTWHGSRVANVRVEAWQARADEPVATLHGHFLVSPKRA